MHTYVNGNTIVEIYDDGTKIRHVPDGEPAQPLFPESIDLKITNRCEMGCAQCHECSTPDGNHANLLSELIDSFHPYTEVAIGGGNPMMHPELHFFLRKLQYMKVIANITVHWTTFVENYNYLKWLSDEGLIHGIGISATNYISEEVIDKIKRFDNAVVHAIVGVTNMTTFSKLGNKDLKILLLGYKDFGRGKDYKKENDFYIQKKTEYVKDNLDNFFNQFKAVAFDNLAVKQLELEKRLPEDTFKRIYMGDDGTFTMYIDLVERKYAVSSTSERHNIDSNNIDELFTKVRKLKE